MTESLPTQTLRASSDEIDAYFTAKGATQQCPMCGHTEWTIPANTNDGATATLQTLPIPVVRLFCDERALIGEYVGAFAMICITCGFIRLQSFDMLKAWLDGRGHS